MSAIFDRLSTLSEPTRLRILRSLESDEFGVGELARILDLPQSTVSRHLKVLHSGGWLQQRSEGASNLFRAVPDAWTDRGRDLWEVVRTQAEAEGHFEDDDRRRKAALALRKAEAAAFFQRHAGRWDSLRRELYGEAFWLPTLLSLLPEDLVVADLGCGTGVAVAALAPAVRQVIGVDREQAMLEAAGERLAGFDNVELRRGGLNDLPLRDGEVDAALCVLVLHHVEDLTGALAELARVLRSGGRGVILDLVAHDREEYRRTMGHHWLGFPEGALAAAAPADLTVRKRVELPLAEGALGPGLQVIVMEKGSG